MARGIGGIVCRSGREPHVPVRRSRDLGGVGFVAAHEPSELPARLCRSLYRQQEVPHHRHSVSAENEPLNVREVERRFSAGSRCAITPWVIPPSTKQSAKKPRALHRRSWMRDVRPRPTPNSESILIRDHGITVAIRWRIVTCGRPAGLGCPEPRGLDRRCKTRSADSCCPTPTDGTPRRSSLPGLAARQRHAERWNRKRMRSCPQSPRCTSGNHRRRP